MLRKITHFNGVVTLQSPLLAALNVPHGFSTRLGGISDAPFDSLNLGRGCDDRPRDRDDNVARNYQLLQQAIGCEQRQRHHVHQVHGAAVYDVVADNRCATVEADAMISANAQEVLSIRTADCVPILLVAPNGGIVAAVHAGWRSIVAGIISATVNRLTDRYHVTPHDLVAAVGPCIGPDHFEVGEQVAAAFEEVGLQHTIIRRPGAKPHIHLADAVAGQLQAAGLESAAIDRTDYCTCRDRELFFSHRRDNGHTGRMAAMIGGSGVSTNH